MEKKIENLEKERGELSNRLDQLTDEFNEISECMRPHRSFLKRSFMVLDSLASEEEKRCQDNARKVYISELEKDIADAKNMINEVEYAIEIINKPDKVVDLEIGGKPFEYNGFDNGGSTGYQWSVEISDESAVKYIRTSGRGKDTSHLCGGGRDFAFAFYAARPGKVTAKIYHARPWLKKGKPECTIEFRIKECDFHDVMKTMSSTFDRFVSLHKEAKRYGGVTRDLDWSVGEELFRLRRATYLLETALGQKKKNAAQDSTFNQAITMARSKHASLKSKLDDLCERMMILNRRITWLQSGGAMDWSTIMVPKELVTIPEMCVHILGAPKKEIELRGLSLTNKEIEKVISIREKKVDELEKTLTNFLLRVKLSVPLPWSSS